MKILSSQLFWSMLLLTIPSVDVSAQIIDSSQRANNQLIHQQHLKKSESQMVAGKVLAYTGGVCLSTAFVLTIVGLHGLFDPSTPEKNYGNAPEILAIGGATLVVASVPLFLSAKSHKKKVRLYLRDETLRISGIKNEAHLASIGLRLKL